MTRIAQACRRATLAVAALAVSAAVASAQSYNNTTVGGPTFNRTVECSGLSLVGTAVRYHVQGVYTGTAGVRTFTSVATNPVNWDNYLFLYANPFNPLAPTVGCLAGNDDGPAGIGQSQFSFNMAANTQYFLVTSGFGNDDAGAFTNTVTGGTVTFGTLPTVVIPEPSTYALLATGVVGLGVIARRRRRV
ncbi:MAG: PEP-CTERM sorting domain-containing protein [Gemmatimonadaceae bacterium]|jgi:hypothetical protein|nr:PEP-CTERM sorting domain-containing protein [Gemmatimonadaceae bacterium]